MERAGRSSHGGRFTIVGAAINMTIGSATRRRAANRERPLGAGSDEPGEEDRAWHDALEVEPLAR